uniref:Uncharacterized protein n=1 Tax=Parascaris univalens TaxID=6257 RepID=A0A915BD77_PARUN
MFDLWNSSEGRTNAMTLSILILICAIIYRGVESFKFGAVLHEKQDAHLVAAIEYAVEWLNAHNGYEHVSCHIEFVNSKDYFAAVATAFRTLGEEWEAEWRRR